MAKVYIWCDNEKCDQFRKEQIYNNGKKKYVLKNGRLVLANIPCCPVCGRQFSYREEIEEQEGPISVNIGEFSGMTPDRKASMLKKRYQEDNKKKDIEGRIKEKRDKTIRKFFNE